MVPRGALSGLRQFLATEKVLKMMKNAFYFTLKFFLEIFGKRLDKNTKVNFKIYDVTNWIKKITMHILPNISINKGNETIILG